MILLTLRENTIILNPNKKTAVAQIKTSWKPHNPVMKIS